MNSTIAGDLIVQSFERGRLSRRQMVGQLMALGAAAATGAATGAPLVAQTTRPAAAAAATFAALGIDHIALAVTDVRRSTAFYQQHLGLTLTRDGGESSAFLDTSGGDFLALFRAGTAGLHHFSFAIPNYSADDAAKRIEATGLKLDRQQNRVYFPDPDGLIVQVSGARRRAE